VESVTCRKLRNHEVQRSDEKSLCIVFVPYVRGVCEKFRRISECYNIRTFFRTKYAIESCLRKTKPVEDKLEKFHHVYKIPCECGRDHIGETGRLGL
jgi:hypothetical protein